jgi:hypothetical protein
MNVKPSLRITSSLSINPEQPIQGSNYTATFSIRNDSSRSVDIGYPFVVVRGPQGQNLDIGINSGERVIIPANSTYNYSKQWPATTIGQHTLRITSWIPETGQLTDIPADTNINKSFTMNVKPR